MRINASINDTLAKATPTLNPANERDVVVLTGGTRQAKILDWQMVAGDAPF